MNSETQKCEYDHSVNMIIEISIYGKYEKMLSISHIVYTRY